MYLEHCSPLLWLLFSPVGSSFPLLAAKQKHIYWPSPQTDACLLPFPLSLQPTVTCQGLVVAASSVHCLTLPLFRSLFAASSEVPCPCLPAWHASSLPPAPAVLWALSRRPPSPSDLLSAPSSRPCLSAVHPWNLEREGWKWGWGWGALLPLKDPVFGVIKSVCLPLI